MKNKKEFVLKIKINQKIGDKVYYDIIDTYTFDTIKKVEKRIQEFKNKNCVEIVSINVYERITQYKEIIL